MPGFWWVFFAVVVRTASGGGGEVEAFTSFRQDLACSTIFSQIAVEFDLTSPSKCILFNGDRNCP